MKRLLLASIATCCCLLTVQSANAKGCLEGAALGGAVRSVIPADQKLAGFIGGSTSVGSMPSS